MRIGSKENNWRHELIQNLMRRIEMTVKNKRKMTLSSVMFQIKQDRNRSYRVMFLS